MVCQLHSARCVILALACSLVGCSIHPLPDNHPLNFPRASTFDIVQRVRCEAKAGLDSFRNRKRPRTREHIEKIISATSIGYDFEFIMSEDSDIGGALGFQRPDQSRTLSINGSANQHRANTRNFRIIETLADVANIRPEACPEKPGPNLAYPISGSLRVDEVLRTYIRLERISDLQEDERVDDLPSKDHVRPGVFSETLTFKTALTGSATPTLTLSAVAGSFRLRTAGLGASATRSDEHTLVIAFAQSREFKDDEYSRKVRSARDERRSLVGWDNKLIRGAKTEAAIAQASTEYARNQVALELARVRNLLDDERDRVKFLGQQLLRALRPPDETGPDD